MSKDSVQKRRIKPGLVTTTGIYLGIAIALLVASGLVLGVSLIKISKLATTTRDTVLPSVLDRQRTAVNLERLGRFAEIIRRAEDSGLRREYLQAARILAHDPAFLDDPELNISVQSAFGNMESIALLRNGQDKLKEQYEEALFRFMPDTDNSTALRSIPQGAQFTNFLIRADRTTSLGQLAEIKNRFDEVAQSLSQDSKAIRDALQNEAKLLDLRRDILKADVTADNLWKRTNESLETLSANLSTKAAVQTDEGFTIIADNADLAVKTGIMAVASLSVAMLILIFFARRSILQPILRTIDGLNRISRGERDVKLPEEGLREFEEIRLAVERSAALVFELGDKTEEMEQINLALEKEIDQRQKTQELLARAKERAEQADRAKSEYLAGMSHEIRTPLNSMIGMVELLLEEDLPPKQRTHIESIKTSGTLLLSIINDVLDLSKIEAGEVVLEVVDIDRGEFLELTRQIVAAKADSKGIDFIIDVDDDVPRVFRSDPTRLRQILVNLIDNGIKFTDQGEVRLAIQRSTLDGNEALTFAVIDTGIGIPGDVQKTIFNRFSQADSSTTRQYGGTGLGLSICQCLVEMMGGSLKVESAPGQGTAFYFTLCLECLERSTPKSFAPVSLSSASVEALQCVPLSILVAEDSESNRALIDLYFKKTACTIDFAENGNEAIEKFSKYEYNLILMDIQMPGMDGYEATRRIRIIERERHAIPIPILAVTANAFKEDQERSRDAGCTDYLAKPVSKPVLLERVAFHAIHKTQKDA